MVVGPHGARLRDFSRPFSIGNGQRDFPVRGQVVSLSACRSATTRSARAILVMVLLAEPSALARSIAALSDSRVTRQPGARPRWRRGREVPAMRSVGLPERVRLYLEKASVSRYRARPGRCTHRWVMAAHESRIACAGKRLVSQRMW